MLNPYPLCSGLHNQHVRIYYLQEIRKAQSYSLPWKELVRAYTRELLTAHKVDELRKSLPFARSFDITLGGLSQ